MTIPLNRNMERVLRREQQRNVNVNIMMEIYIDFIKENIELIVISTLTFLFGIGIGSAITDLLNVKEKKQ